MAQVNHLQDIDEKDLRDVVLLRTSVGACLRGCFRSTGRHVAVKLLTDSKWIDRLQRVRICCEHVLVPLGVYRAHSLVGLVWDWMTEGSLDSTLHEKDLFPELSTALCLRILLDVAEGLAHLHAIRLPHGALKGTNVLLDQQYHAKLCDWGQEIDWHLIMNTSGACRPCYRDLAYMSPEGAIPSLEADIYSFGILLWETLNRKRPCEVGMDQLQALLHSAQEKLELGVRDDRLEPMTPQNHVLTQLIIRCLHNNPKKRPSAQECAVVLQKAVAVFDPQTFIDAVLHLKTSKEKKLNSSWELPIELHNLEQSGNCTGTKNWTSKVIPRNETHSSQNPKSEAKVKVSAQMTRYYPQIRCCMDAQKNSVQAGSSSSDHGFTQTTGHCGSTHVAPTRQSPTSLRSHWISPAALYQSTLQHNAGNQVTCQMSSGRSCCQLLQERREVIVRFMTEGRLNNVLDVLRARKAVTRETYEIITAALTLNAKTRCLLDICSCLGENVALLVATTLGLVSTKNTHVGYKWQAG